MDDLAILTGRLPSGALVSFEGRCFATGRRNALSLEVSGDRGPLTFDLEDLNWLCDYDRAAPEQLQELTATLVTEPSPPNVHAWWPAVCVLGYEHGFVRQTVDFVTGIRADTEALPTFAAGSRYSACLTRSSAVRRARPRGRACTRPHWHRCGNTATIEGAHLTRPITFFTGRGQISRSRTSRVASPNGDTAAWRSRAGQTHLDPNRWDKDSYIQGKLDVLERNGLRVWTISNRLKGQAVCDEPIGQSHRGTSLTTCGAMSTRRVCVSGQSRS